MPAGPRRTRRNRLLVALAAAWMAIALAIRSVVAETPRADPDTPTTVVGEP